MGWPIVTTTYYANNLLAGATDASLSGPLLLAAARCGLGKALITPAKSTTWADVVEADYTGYAEPATIVWSPLINEADGSQTSDSPVQFFRCTGASSVTVNNFFINDGVGISSITHSGSASTGILGSGTVPGGFPFVNVGDGFSMIISWNSGADTLNNQAVVNM